MRITKAILLGLFILYFTACNTIAPTPLLMGRVSNLNSEVHELYLDCSSGGSYKSTLESCDAGALETKLDELLDISEQFISADIKQPQGYDIHLEASMIFFRIAQRNANDYSRAEQIARQFFEVQKATGGRSLDVARFYWPWFAASNSSYQYYNAIGTLDQARKVDLLAAMSEGTDLTSRITGPRASRLQTALAILNFIIFSIEDGT